MGDCKRRVSIVPRNFAAFALAFAMLASPPGNGRAQTQSLDTASVPDTASVEDASGLRVVAVRAMGRPTRMELVFDEPSADILRKFSTRAAGREVDFFVNGQRVATLKLRGPITGNAVMLTGDFSDAFKKSLEEPVADSVSIKIHR